MSSSRLGLNMNTYWFFPFIPSIQSADESHYLWNRISHIFLLCYHGSTWQDSFLYPCLWFVNRFPNEPLDVCLVAHLFLWIQSQSLKGTLLLVMSCSCWPTSGSLSQWNDFKILSPSQPPTSHYAFLQALLSFSPMWTVRCSYPEDTTYCHLFFLWDPPLTSSSS